MMKTIKLGLFITLSAFALSGFSAGKLYQVSTIGALTAGVFDGDTRYNEIETHGDFGLGTFEGLNGEMVALNGTYYRMDKKGNLSSFDKKTLAPFAEVTYFHKDKSFKIHNIDSYSSLKNVLLKNIKNKNIPYAIKITGKFDDIFMRSLLHYKKPYPSLVTASKEQIEFTLNHLDGTLVGFWFPSYWGIIAVNGFHFHFINKSLTKGGHVLNMKIKEATVEFMPIYVSEIKLPTTNTFSESAMGGKDLQHEIEQAES